MRQTALINSQVLSIIFINIAIAQVPSIDPSQTVNPATGEMGFALPIANVEELNGHSFPILIGLQRFRRGR